jgi:putative copper resistance protein D
LIEPLTAVRAVHFASTVTVAGAVLFECFVADAAFRSAAKSPLRVALSFRARLSVLLLASLVVTVVSGAGWLLLLAAGIGDQSVSEAITGGTAWLVFTQTRFGIDWQLRLLLAALLTARELLGLRSSSCWSGLFAASAGILLVASLAWAGHGAATPGSAGYAHLIADIFHLIAAGAWLGGLLPLVLLLRLLRCSDEPGWATMAGDVTDRFSNLGVFAVGALLFSGVTNASFLAGGVQALVTTYYGRLLLLKIALFASMVCLAGTNRQYLLPRLSRSFGDGADASAPTAQMLERSAIAEIILGLGVLIIVGMLGIAPPPDVHAHVH